MGLGKSRLPPNWPKYRGGAQGTSDFPENCIRRLRILENCFFSKLLKNAYTCLWFLIKQCRNSVFSSFPKLCQSPGNDPRKFIVSSNLPKCRDGSGTTQISPKCLSPGRILETLFFLRQWSKVPIRPYGF